MKVGSDRAQHQNRHSSREFSGTNRQASNKGWNVTEGNRPPQGGKTWADEDHLTTKEQRDERRPIQGDLRDIINERSNNRRTNSNEWDDADWDNSGTNSKRQDISTP